MDNINEKILCDKEERNKFIIEKLRTIEINTKKIEEEFSRLNCNINYQEVKDKIDEIKKLTTNRDNLNGISKNLFNIINFKFKDYFKNLSNKINDLELLLRIEGNSKSLGIIEESINEIISKQHAIYENNNKYLEALNELREGQKFLKEINQKQLESIENIKNNNTDLNRILSKNESLQQESADIKIENTRNIEKITRLEQEFLNTSIMLEKVKSELSNLNKEKNDLGNDLTILRLENEKQKDIEKELDNKQANLIRENEDLIQQLDTRTRELDAKKLENEELKTQMTTVIEAQKKSVEESLTEKNKELNLLKNEYELMKNSYNTVNKKIVEPHLELLKSISSCSRVNLEMHSIGLNPDLNNIDNFIILSSLVNDFKLAEWIQRVFESSFKEKGYINEEEIIFINDINAFYRTKYMNPVTWDILFVPVGKNFDREIIRDSKNPSEIFRTFKNTYVPGLKTKEGKITIRAIVDGER